MPTHSDNPGTGPDLLALSRRIKAWGRELGFQQLAITDVDLTGYQKQVERWLQEGNQGAMAYLERNLEKRLAPDRLIPGTQRIISARMDYLPGDTQPLKILKQREIAYISRYALGRDYHKVMRKRLARLASRINEYLGENQYGTDRESQALHPRRAFVDSAPVLEKALAEKAGLGWIGKNTLLLNREAGSWFFLGEIFLDLPLPIDEPTNTPGDHSCGACRACLSICPTGALVAPGQLDARRCISYLTIENPGGIPIQFRRAIGNRIFGCDDCQLLCPWNRYARASCEADFTPRHGLDRANLLHLFQLNEQEFLRITEGTALRRIKYWQWLRNLSISLGNAPYDPSINPILESRRAQLQRMPQKSLLEEHFDWAVAEQTRKKDLPDHHSQPSARVSNPRN